MNPKVQRHRTTLMIRVMNGRKSLLHASRPALVGRRCGKGNLHLTGI
jgi:hypothetical protein